MFVRIVKMSFEPSKIDEFLELFDSNKTKIRNFEGCSFLELYQDKSNSNVFFTYSHWEHNDHLENYRHSQLFKTVWKNTKALFNDKPQAWSLDILHSVE